MNLIISVMSDVFFWGSLPLFIGVEIFQSHLDLTSFVQTLLQVVLFIVIAVWALFWLNLGEINRLRIQFGLEDKTGEEHSSVRNSSRNAIELFITNRPNARQLTTMGDDCESLQSEYVTRH